MSTRYTVKGARAGESFHAAGSLVKAESDGTYSFTADHIADLKRRGYKLIKDEAKVEEAAEEVIDVVAQALIKKNKSEAAEHNERVNRAPSKRTLAPKA